MRITLLIASLGFLVACKSRHSSSGDMAIAVVSDMAVVASDDMPIVIPSCSITAQTGCKTSEKCIPKINFDGSISGLCVANGAVAVGGTCTRTTDTDRLDDNCIGGAICDNRDNGNAAFMCRTICAADTGCPTSGDKCLTFNDRGFGVCMKTCTALSNDCASGFDCAASYHDIAASSGGNSGYFVCKPTGSLTIGGDCDSDGDCAAGLWCDANNRGCVPACDNANPCSPASADGGGLNCMPYSNLANGAGYCN